ncbi:sirohydrochlorin chelatase [Ottowia thiooxydans]|uniref:sirohydrochlorin chelatase n=1 Tax=Ottowia thiooxydans TaxID=219182 RepID=UPI00048DC629|nr:CbiX/SirB N-terminal domain-containing protein [Ottowia thiooxydans]
MSPSRATVLFAHGSRDPAWSAPIEAVAQRMRQIQPGSQVACAYLELTAPDLATCVAPLLSAGVRAITVWPMFLGSGRHAREDLPRLIRELSEQHPEIEFNLQPAIGEHPDVLDVMARTALGTGI